jgi:hypothetical protein
VINGAPTYAETRLRLWTLSRSISFPSRNGLTINLDDLPALIAALRRVALPKEKAAGPLQPDRRSNPRQTHRGLNRFGCSTQWLASEHSQPATRSGANSRLAPAVESRSVKRERAALCARGAPHVRLRMRATGSLTDPRGSRLLTDRHRGPAARMKQHARPTG